jgi:phytoene synthase
MSGGHPGTISLGEQSSSFRFSFSFLPKERREAIRAVYAFCRTTDDLVDDSADVNAKVVRLKAWREEVERAMQGNSSSQFLNNLSKVARRFNIPVVHFEELLKGVEMDLVKNRYETFEELTQYCYHVASSVGLMCLGIFGSEPQRTRDYAVNLGIALQLTNILRDVGIDATYGRIYLPQEDLLRFGCSENDILNHRYSDSFIRLMEFETGRAEEYFRRSQAALPKEERRAMFAAKIMERIYFHTLQRIKDARFHVFEHRVVLPKSIQFLIALKYWVKQRLLGL